MSTAAFLMLELTKWKCFYAVHAKHNNVIKWPTAGLGGGGWEFYETIKKQEGQMLSRLPFNIKNTFYSPLSLWYECVLHSSF